MNIYKLGADLAYGSLVFAHTPEISSNEEQQLKIWSDEFSDWSHHCEMVGWRPPPIGYGRRNRARALPLDCVHLALGSEHDMLLSPRAQAALSPLLLPNGRFLPVQWEEREYRIFECKTVVDVADHDQLERNGMGWIDRWSFHHDRLAVAPAIFTVPQDRRTRMCTDVFRDAVDTQHLLGFEFQLLWSSGIGGIKLDNSPSQFFGDSGKRMRDAAKERRKAMLKLLKTREREANDR